MTKLPAPGTALCALALALLMAGCPATRSTFDVPIPQAQPTPSRGFIKLTEVKDLRRFEIGSGKPSVPSLESADELKDRSITSRAIARKRGGYGQAMADVLLPEGRTVEQLVREAVTAALSESGYSVVNEKSPEYGKALQLRVEIEQFWAWNTPAGVPFQVSLEFESVLLLQGAVMIGGNAARVRGYRRVQAVPTDDQWQELMRSGVADLINKVKASVTPAI